MVCIDDICVTAEKQSSEIGKKLCTIWIQTYKLALSFFFFEVIYCYPKNIDAAVGSLKALAALPVTVAMLLQHADAVDTVKKVIMICGRLLV